MTSLVEVSRYRPAVRFGFDWRKFFIKTADDGDELDQVLRLRHRVFYEELLGRSHPDGRDFDRFDLICDHLLVRDRESDRLIATYRFNSSRFHDEFYTGSEFDLAPFLALPGNKLDMGRACIDPDHRGTQALMALGQGLGRYAAETDTRFLFGCSSIHTTDLRIAARLGAWFRRNDALHEDLVLPVLPGFAFPGFEAALGQVDPDDPCEDIAELVPPLLRSYLRAGARVSKVPALDEDFHCTDFFTVLDLVDSNPVFMGRYVPHDRQSG